MNSAQLFYADQKPAHVFYCGKCRQVSSSEQIAEQCCQNRKCTECGADTGDKYWMICPACREAKEVAAEKERFEKAERVTAAEWEGPVQTDSVGNNDGYFASIGELLDYLSDWEDYEEGEKPTYAWTCHSQQTCLLDVDQIIEGATSDAHEDFDPDGLDGIEELKAAVDAFNAKNTGDVTWTPNYKKAVIL